MSEESLDPRHISRALALQQLFNILEGGEVDSESNSQFDPDDLLETLESEAYDHELYTKLMEALGDSEIVDRIDDVITQLAPTWPIAQIAPIDLIILRTGIWEGFMSKLTPTKVVINECIELAKEFGGENSSSFINGVLGALLEKPNLQKLL